MRRGCWQYQLQDWGENTPGGHNYGYTINIWPIKGLPKRKPKWGFKFLRVDANYLKKVGKND
jgi:hypothetical protein